MLKCPRLGQVRLLESLPGIVDVDNGACSAVCEAHNVECMPTLALVEAKLKPWNWMIWAGFAMVMMVCKGNKQTSRIVLGL